MEESFDLSTGHEEMIAIVERCLHGLEGERRPERSGR
jgi:hypothetical protein